MKQFIISLSICLLFNLLCNETLIGHFSLFYIQVMILFVIEEVHLRWNEYFHYWDYHVSTTDSEEHKLYTAITGCPQLNLDITELGFILVPEELTANSILLQQYSPNAIQQYNQAWNYSSHKEIGIAWLIARGYTADKLDELIEDMPRILIYLKNVQTAKAIESL